MEETIAVGPTVYPELQKLTALVNEQPESLATGGKSIREAALDATKLIFDLSLQSEPSSIGHVNDLITSLQPFQGPVTRSQKNANDKAESEAVPPPAFLQPTPLSSLFVEGMQEDAVWAQLDIRLKSLCDTLDFVLEGGPAVREDEDGEGGESSEEDSEDDGEVDDERLNAILQALENGEDIDLDALREELGDDGDSDSFDEGSEGEDEDEEEDKESEEETGSGMGLDGEEGTMDLRDPEEEGEDGQPTSMSGIIGRHTIGKRKGKGHPELDDGFFDLAAFNAETERAEAKSSSKGRLGGDEDSDSDAMSVDLFALVGQDNFDEEDEENDGGSILYRDFFDPPRLSGIDARQKQKTLPVRPTGRVRFNDTVKVRVLDKGSKRAVGPPTPADGKKKQSITFKFGDLMAGEPDDEESDEGFGMESIEETQWGEEDDEDESAEGGDEEDEESESDEGCEEDDGEDDDDDDLDLDDRRRAIIERSKDDLFAEELAPDQDLSTHEKRLAELQAEISQLESENVGPKDWVLMGEADSRKRPQNSLLEEDLEFERAMKAVPVVTEQTVQDLEERIKARILEGRFDDVVRIRAVEDRPFLPSKYFELKDTKSTQSLAQIYEDDYMGAQTGGAAGEDRDGKLKKEHEEIEQIWENLSNKLDALCNTHYTPRQPKAIISTISNASTATLESALPTTQSTSTLLAPEEMFAPLSGAPQARSEMTPAQKKALHNKQRKAKKKSRDALDKRVDKVAAPRGISGVKKQKQAALESVVKSGKGVTVVGKPKAGKDRSKVGVRKEELLNISKR